MPCGTLQNPYNIMPPERQATPRTEPPLLTPGHPPLPSGWTPEAVIRLLEPLSEERRRARILEVTRARVGAVTVLMDMPHDPHNAAAVVRSADAFGVPEVNVVLRDEAFLVGHRVA